MKNIILDVMMGLICIVCVLTIFGLFVLPVVLDYWDDMRG